MDFFPFTVSEEKNEPQHFKQWARFDKKKSFNLFGRREARSCPLAKGPLIRLLETSKILPFVITFLH